MCYLSNASRNQAHYVIGRRTNRGAAEDDFYTMHARVDCEIDTKGEDNNKTTSILLFTTRHASYEMSREVTVIQNQHECLSKRKSIQSSA